MITDIDTAYQLYLTELRNFKTWLEKVQVQMSDEMKANPMMWGGTDYDEWTKRNHVINGMEKALGLTQTEIQTACRDIGL